MPTGHAHRDKNRYKMTTPSSPASFGAWVRTRRRQLDLTQAELGARAGCSEAAIRKIEADERKPSRQLAELLAAALEIPAPEKESFLQFARGVLVDEIRHAPKTYAHNLPTLLTTTIDRTRDLANVSSLLKDANVHLVTLIGPPGIGKTRLSIQCGNALLDAFPDGVWFVELADVTNVDFFIPTLARFLPTLSLPPSPNLDQLLSGLRDKHLLLILDNFEQLAEGAALAMAQLLKTCPHVNLLVTSRVPLHIYGENEYPLPPLSIPPRNAEPGTRMQFESVQLFVARTRQHQPKFTINAGNAAAVIEICTVLDGIPLALELAAATLRQMTLDEMVAVLHAQDWVKHLATPARDLPQRQRTLENVIAWSHILLNEEQKEAFCKLGVFNGWFDADAATTLCETSAQPFLNALTDHSLLVREIVHGQPHWRMLELIRTYAVARLSSDERSRLELLRVNYLLQHLRHLKQNAPRLEQEQYFQTAFGNLLAALQWTVTARQPDLGFALEFEVGEVWIAFGYFKEALDIFRQLLALPSNADPIIQADRLHAAADLAWQQHDFETAVFYIQQAVELGRQYGLHGKQATLINRLGRIFIEQGRYPEAKQVLQEGLELARQGSASMGPGIPTAQLGEIALFEGRLEEAKSLLEQALTLEMGDDAMIFTAMARTDLAEVALAQGDSADALRWLKEAQPLASQQARRFVIFLCALAGYLVLTKKGSPDPGTAAHLYGAIERLSLQAGVGLNGFYQELNRSRMVQAQKKLSAAEWRKAYETGSSWGRDEVLRLIQELLA